LTTNRVGMFDEAFISRINLTIYYPPFSTRARAEVWESFFSKLEREREGKIRVHNNTRAYVEESDELNALQWNGREIRNGKYHVRLFKPSLIICSLPDSGGIG
jgi:hypothetical protein